jgi:hypothetical protein
MEINNLKIGKERRPDDEVRAFFNASTASLFFNFQFLSDTNVRPRLTGMNPKGDCYPLCMKGV